MSGHRRLSSRLKEQLIRQSLRRKQDQIEQPDRGGSVTGAAGTPTDFTTHPSYQQLQVLREGGERLGVGDPFFRLHEGCAGAITRIGGREVINFSNYNYLGLCGNPAVSAAAKEAVDRYGTSVSASRIVSGERPLHQHLERALADAYGVEAAVAFVSGHATNVSTIGHLLQGGDLILHDELIHNSTLVGAQLSGAARMSFPHNDLGALEQLLREQRPRFRRALIVVEGLYSMDGDYPDLTRLVALKQQHQCWLMVDEAHSFGVMGERGLGIREHFGLDGADVDIWMGTLSKSLASCGGYIAGSQPLVDILRNFAPGFLYSVGMPPAMAAAASAALKTMLAEPERVQRLQARSKTFLSLVEQAGFDTGPDCAGLAVVPIITGNSVKAVRWSESLLDAGINVQPILYPAVQERNARLRFFLSSEHTEEQLRQAASALQDLS